jgi:hypothetical protein
MDLPFPLLQEGPYAQVSSVATPFRDKSATHFGRDQKVADLSRTARPIYPEIRSLRAISL